jgi:regulator of protease activity HflC (stomatin/prohibitin superfamily)
MTEQVKISRSAVASLVLGLLFFFPLIPAGLAVILGIVARRHIHRSEGRYRGKGLAAGGIILGVIQGICWIFLLFSGVAYVIGPDEVAVITRFGAIQKTAGPGLNFKMPIIDKANRFPVRVYFEWQSAALEFVTSDGQRVTLRAKIRYRICNPVRYFQKVGLADKRLAASKIEDIFYADIMDEANKHPLNEFVLSVRNLSLQKTLHNNFNTKLNLLGMCMHKVDEPYEVLEKALK